MFNMNSKAMKNLLANLQNCLIRKGDRSKGLNTALDDDIIKTNRLIKIVCEDTQLQPRKCAEIMSDKYGYDLDGRDVIDIFKSFHISQDERMDMTNWANELGALFTKILESAKVEDYKAFVSKRKETVITRHAERAKIQDQFACMKLCVLLPEIGRVNKDEIAEKFGAVLSKYYLYDITEELAKYCNVDIKGNPLNTNAESAAYKDKIGQLEQTLSRSDMMLKDLQDEFDERLEESKVKELIDFFSRLNSEKYGCILDELLNVRRGVSQLKKQHYELPPEIGGLLIMTQKLTQFVRDSGINPIMKTQEIKMVKAADIDFCDYNGSPFKSKDEQKKIKVISPGWIYADKDIKIARPKVKEVDDDE